MMHGRSGIGFGVRAFGIRGGGVRVFFLRFIYMSGRRGSVVTEEF